MKTILIAGSGQFCHEWLKSTKNRYVNVVLSRSFKREIPSEFHIQDLSDLENTRRLIYKIQPDVVLNAAAITNLEHCKNSPEAAFRSNVLVAQNLAQISHDLNVPFVHLSTDNFENDPTDTRDENVLPIPVNNYGETKIQAEKEIKLINKRYLIIRTNYYSLENRLTKSFLDDLVYKIKNNKTYFGANDYSFNPVSSKFLVESIEKLLSLKFSGTLNVTSDACISKYEFALLVCKYLKLNPKLIQEVKLCDISNLVQRPQKLCLINTKLKRILELSEINLKEQLSQTLIEGIL